MTLRRDHVAGGAVVAAALGVLAISADLPFGTPASPGPGMLPILAAGLVLALGAVMLLQAGSSPPFTQIAWPDLPHAARVCAVTAASLLSYERLGFLITTTALLLILVLVVERRPLWPGLLFCLVVPVSAYLLLAKLLKSALPVGVLGI